MVVMLLAGSFILVRHPREDSTDMSSYIQSRNNAIQTQRIKLQQVRNRLADAQSSRASAGDIAFWQSEVIIAERVLARLERRR